MYPKGVDFYINPWIGDKFAPITSGQQTALAEIPGFTSKTEPLQPEPYPDFFGLNEFAGIDTLAEDYGEVEDAPVEDVINAFMYYDSFANLPSSIQTLLSAKGHSEEEWDGLSPALREKIIKCL